MAVTRISHSAGLIVLRTSASRRLVPFFVRYASSNTSVAAASKSSGSNGSTSRLVTLEDAFRAAVDAHLPASGHGVVFATAWLATDNVIVALLRRFYPELNYSLMAVDTLHLFPETHVVAAAVQAKYGKTASVFRPLGVTTREEFTAKYGDAETLNHAEFDLHSKVEPYTRGLAELGKTTLLTGRRMDQGEKRVALDVWEQQPRILNPLAGWSWSDVTAYVDAHNVPVNPAHDYVFRSPVAVPATQRHLPAAQLPWTKTDLGKPFWRATAAELLGEPPAAHAYVYKSFGDTHTSVPVYPHESERTGRFVRTANTECGIHTRAAAAGAPHGGKLVDRMAHPSEVPSLVASCGGRTLALTERQSCDVELLLNGGFSPLTGFMGRAEYDSVVDHMRLPEQQLWAMPITLDVGADARVTPGDNVLLTYNGANVAVLRVSEVWVADKRKEAERVFGTTSLEHPGVADLLNNRGERYVGGTVTGIALPQRPMECATPAKLRATSPASASAPLVAFQCRNPLHRSHFELITRVLSDVPGARVLVHPTVGPTQPGDIDGVTRVATYRALAAEVADPRISWAFLPFNMRMAGPREAIQHMIVRKNYGATHFIVGRDMAGTKSTVTGEDFYGPYDAQVLAKKHADELKMTVVTYENMVYTGSGYLPESEAKAKGVKPVKMSGTEFRKLLASGGDIPEWYSFRSVIAALREGERQRGRITQ